MALYLTVVWSYNCSLSSYIVWSNKHLYRVKWPFFNNYSIILLIQTPDFTKNPVITDNVCRSQTSAFSIWNPLQTHCFYPPLSSGTKARQSNEFSTVIINTQNSTCNIWRFSYRIYMYPAITYIATSDAAKFGLSVWYQRLTTSQSIEGTSFVNYTLQFLALQSPACICILMYPIKWCWCSKLTFLYGKSSCFKYN